VYCRGLTRPAKKIKDELRGKGKRGSISSKATGRAVGNNRQALKRKVGLELVVHDLPDGAKDSIGETTVVNCCFKR